MTPANSPAEFAEVYASVASANARSLDRLERLLKAFAREGIDCLLLKGADLLTRVYGPRGLRGIGDVDLLVRERDLDRIDAAMLSLGMRPKIDGNAAYNDPDGAFPVDLASRIWYLEDEEPVWRRAVSREWRGLAVRAMDAADALLYQCLWVSVHRAWLSTAFAEDVYRLTSEEEIDWERFCAETVRLGLRAPVIHALAYASRKRPIVVADLAMAVLSDMSPLDRAKLWALRRLVGEKRLPGLSHLLVLATRPGRRAAALRASLAPDDRFLRWRYGRRSAPALLAIRAARPFYLAGQGALLLVRILTRLVRGSDAASI